MSEILLANTNGDKMVITFPDGPINFNASKDNKGTIILDSSLYFVSIKAEEVKTEKESKTIKK